VEIEYERASAPPPGAPVALPGLINSRPSCSCALNWCVCPVTRMSTHISRAQCASASTSPHGMSWCPCVSPILGPFHTSDDIGVEFKGVRWS
jgi:hypothetical protein